MQTFNEQFGAAMAAIQKAQDAERPLWEEVCRFGADNAATMPFDLADSWYAKRLDTEAAFKRLNELIRANSVPG